MRELPEYNKLSNGGVQCDMLIGPCSCGATHSEQEIVNRISSELEKSLKHYIGQYDVTEQTMRLISETVSDHLKSIDPIFDWDIKVTSGLDNKLIVTFNDPTYEPRRDLPID